MAKHEYHWTFGEHCHIRFPNGGNPVVENDHAFTTHEGCATISDSYGNLLFYTDGVKLYDPANSPVTAPDLGGSWSSSHSAIIVPPAGGGSSYHVFTMRAWDIGPVGPLSHSTFGVGGGGVSLLSPPTKLTTLGPPLASERLAAVPHRDCGKYWVIAMDGGTPSKKSADDIKWLNDKDLLDRKAVGKTQAAGTPPPPPAAPGKIYAILVDSDSAPTTQTVTAYPFPISAAYCCKISPDGSMLAVASDHTVDLLRFDRATGAFTGHSQLTGFSGTNRAYGVEFSPSSRYLYVSVVLPGEIYRHDIQGSSGATTPKGLLDLVGTTTTLVHSKYRIGALQLGPNGKIYGVKVMQPTLLEIADPDHPSPGSVQFNVDAVKAGGGKLELNKKGILGLPTFARITPDCDDRCSFIAGQVEAQLNEGLSGLHNGMAPCRDKHGPHGKPDEPHEPHDHGAAASKDIGPGGTPAHVCRPLEIPPLRPRVSIRWGNSPCDCIEGDDTEIMHLTICNPYSNVTLSNLVVHQLTVVDANGKPVPKLPDGSPSIQLVPVGPYCFDDIAPCACVTREFVLRLRGAPGGPYRILLKGICFDACFHGDEEACFTFQVCKD